MAVIHDWQANKNLNQSLLHMVEQEQYTDVMFTFPDSGRSVVGHKLILASRSPVFETMFFGSLPEGGVVEIVDAKPQDFQAFLKFLYSEDRSYITRDNTPAFVYLGDKYQVACLQFLTPDLQLPDLRQDNCLEALDKAARESKPNNAFLNTLMKAVCEHGPNLRLLPLRTNISHDTLMLLARIQFVPLSELELFQFCDNWALRECVDYSYRVTPEKKRELLGDVFQFIRFPLIPLEDLGQYVLPLGYFTPQEESCLLRKQCGVKLNNFPFDCTPRHGIKVALSAAKTKVFVTCYKSQWTLLGFVTTRNIIVTYSISGKMRTGAMWDGSLCFTSKNKYMLGDHMLTISGTETTIRLQADDGQTGVTPRATSTRAKLAEDYGPEQVMPLDLGPGAAAITGLIYAVQH